MSMIKIYPNHANDNILHKAKKIKLIISDVDGVMTDGSIYLDKEGNDVLMKFNALDGMGINMALQCGLQFAIISGRKSHQVEIRGKNLNIQHIYLGITNKVEIVNLLIKKLNINYDEIAYIGDDVNDLGVLNLVGLKVAPPNANDEVLNRVELITKKSGGCGALRELIDYILNAQNLLSEYLAVFI